MKWLVILLIVIVFVGCGPQETIDAVVIHKRVTAAVGGFFGSRECLVTIIRTSLGEIVEVCGAQAYYNLEVGDQIIYHYPDGRHSEGVTRLTND